MSESVLIDVIGLSPRIINKR